MLPSRLYGFERCLVWAQNQLVDQSSRFMSALFLQKLLLRRLTFRRFLLQFNSKHMLPMAFLRSRRKLDKLSVPPNILYFSPHSAVSKQYQTGSAWWHICSRFSPNLFILYSRRHCIETQSKPAKCLFYLVLLLIIMASHAFPLSLAHIRPIFQLPILQKTRFLVPYHQL